LSKKILLLSQFSPPETNSAANRVDAMARKMAEHYEVCVASLKPGYPNDSFYEAPALEQHDRALSYETKRASSFHPHKGGLLVRAMREQAMALRLMGRAALSPADIVMASSPSMFLGPAALVLAWSKRAKFVWDVRDVTWNYAKEARRFSPLITFGLRALEKYMLFVLRQADLLVGATPGITKLLVANGLAPDKTVTITNGASEAVLAVAPTAADRNTRSTRPKIVYAGLIGYNQGIGVLPEVAEMLPEADFVLAGDGPELPLLTAQVRKSGITNVFFTGYLTRENLMEVYSESDILFAKVRSTPTLDATAVPSKLFEYMATGRPLVYAGRGAAVELLERIGCALIAPPEDPRAIAAAIRMLLSNPDLRLTLGGKGREFVQKNNRRETLMETLVNELQERFGR
jgi:glycosyltransferase involved in cell wall biosynthesis